MNSAILLGELKRTEEALCACEEVVSRYGDSAEAAPREPVATALFNIACCHARQARVKQCIEALAEWRDRNGAIGCEMVAGDADFDPVSGDPERGDPAFIAFMAANGCG